MHSLSPFFCYLSRAEGFQVGKAAAWRGWSRGLVVGHGRTELFAESRLCWLRLDTALASYWDVRLSTRLAYLIIINVENVCSGTSRNVGSPAILRLGSNNSDRRRREAFSGGVGKTSDGNRLYNAITLNAIIIRRYCWQGGFQGSLACHSISVLSQQSCNIQRKWKMVPLEIGGHFLLGSMTILDDMIW